MNLLKTKLRRTSTVLGGALMGLVGVATFATPALACHTTITVDNRCVNADGTWVVTWKVQNSEPNIEGHVSDVKTRVRPLSSDSGTLTGITVGAILPKNGDGILTGTQTLPASATRTKLLVEGTWQIGNRGIVNTSESNWVTVPTEKCEPTPQPSESTSPTPSPSASESTSTTPSPSASESTSTSSSPSASESTSTSPSPSGTGPSETPVTEPQFVYDNTCDTLTVGIEVPANWPEDITVTFTPSTGEPKTIVGKRGETTTVDFPASEGLKVTATPKGYEDETASITYEKPADCGGEGGGLPVTGAAAGGIAGGAAVLLAAGAVLFVLARRRKVRFTA